VILIVVPTVAQHSPPVPGWPTVFRGSDAVRAGLVTPGRLRGPGFLRLFPDTYVRRRGEPPGLAERSCAAYLYARGRGVLSGYSAAELLRASSATTASTRSRRRARS
jgi:hypothetical protein